MINYWAIPNMGKMHMMQLIEINKMTYTKTGGRYYFYKQWHDPNNYKKRIEQSFVVRRGQSIVEKPIKTKTTFGETDEVVCEDRHPYLDLVHDSPENTTKMHSNTSEIGGELMFNYFGRVNDRKPPDEFMKGKDPIEVFFTDKYFKERQKHFPVSPGSNYLATFLEPWLLNHKDWIKDHVDEIIDVDILFNPFSLMGLYMLGYPKDFMKMDKNDLQLYVLKLYKSRKNVVPYKENLIDCFASKLKRIKKFDVMTRYKQDKRLIWRHLDGVVRNLRRIEKFLQHNDIEPIYFNMDRDDYGDVFGFHKNELPRTQTHPGNYPEREQFEALAKEYVTIRDIRDMRRRNRLRDRI